MKKILIISLLATLLLANNPRIYSVIGDDVYDNVKAIENLMLLSQYQFEQNKIDKYIYDVKISKQNGFNIESGNKEVSPKEYLNKLRELSKLNAYFIRNIYATFELSVKKENSQLFSEMLNSNLLDTANREKEIMNYYIKHQDEVKINPIIQSLLDKNAALEKRRDAWALRDKRKELARVKRIRDKDKSEQDKMDKSLSEEVIQKKKDIRSHQKKELLIY